MPTGGAVLEWRAEDEFEIDGIAYVCRAIDGVFPSTSERFCLRKDADLIRRLERLLRERQPRTIVEVGVFQGGSTGFIAQVARPERLVCFDLEHRRTALEGMIHAKSLEGVVRPHWGIDQADTGSLLAILDDELGNAPIDLVIDDASHLLEPTRASFDALFPRLRSGGLYVIEDWAWAHGAFNAWPEVTPLTPLIFELVVAGGHRPDVIARVEVNHDWTVVTRGPAELGRDSSLLEHCGELGRGLLPALRTPGEQHAG